MTFLPAVTLSLGIKKILFVPDGILVPGPLNSRPVFFANKFSIMNFFGSLIKCLYYRDDPVIGSLTALAWCLPCIFFDSTTMCCAVGSNIIPFCTCALVLYWCFTRYRSYYFLCSGHSGIVVLFFNFLVYVSLVDTDGGVSWVGLVGFWFLSLYHLSWSTLGYGAVLSFTLGSLELCFYYRGLGGWGVHPYLAVEFLHQTFQPIALLIWYGIPPL